MSPRAASPLRDVDAYTFDVLGTTVDWFTTVKREVALHTGGGTFHDQDAIDFAREWRRGYYAHIKAIYEGGEGSLNLDVVHRKILDEMLTSSRWSHLDAFWDEKSRKELVQVWHHLDAYEDALPGLTELAKREMVIALSNGNYRLLVDLAKNNQLPWDGILSTEFFGVYKPATKAYVSASYHLGIPPERIAMVASHKWDLEGAAQAGFRTIYVPRTAEDSKEIRDNVRSRAEGGDVDLVVKDFRELAALAAEARKKHGVLPTV